MSQSHYVNPKNNSAARRASLQIFPSFDNFSALAALSQFFTFV